MNFELRRLKSVFRKTDNEFFKGLPIFGDHAFV